MTRYIDKNKSKNLSGKSNQKIFDHAKQSAADTLKNSSRNVEKYHLWKNNN